MWTPRSPEEITQWHKNAEREAISHGRMIAGIVWVVVAIVSASGWLFFLSAGTGIAIQRNVTADFWLRVPVFGLIAAPFAYFIFRTEKRKELARIKLRTICPACDTSAENNPGAACKCGGSFVLASTLKWIEK